MMQRVRQEHPDWSLDGFEEGRVASLPSALELLKKGYDAILLHMSLPYGLAVKMAELSHRVANRTKVILYSHTAADRAAIAGLFDGLINPSTDIANVCNLINDLVSADRTTLDEEELNHKILQVINSSQSIRNSILQALRERHRAADFTLDDYNSAVGASVRGDLGTTLYVHDLFVSYSEEDASLALEIVSLFEQRGLSCYLAQQKIKVGSKWQDEIRDALVGSREVLIVLTPESIHSPWVTMELGAAWVLGTTVNPCSLYVELEQMPDPIREIQVQPIKTRAERVALVDKLAERLKK